MNTDVSIAAVVLRLLALALMITAVIAGLIDKQAEAHTFLLLALLFAVWETME